MKKKGLHLLFWIVYILFWAIATNEQEKIMVSAAINICFSIFHISVAYLFYSWTVPKYLAQKKIKLFVSLSLIVFLSNACLLYAALIIFFKNKVVSDFFLLENILPSILFSLFITSVIFVLWRLYEQQQQIKVEKQEVEKNALKLELSLLKNQINPHFLLNSLNNIYFLIEENPKIAADALLKFADILKMQLYEFNTNRINILTEIAYLENYIEIQKLRINEQVKVTFEHDIKNKNLEIAPLLLIVLVENAFKHIPRYHDGLHSIFITIRLITTDDIIVFISENTMDTASQKNNRGIGLKNLEKRLTFLYPNQYTYEKSTKNHVFYTKLIIKC